MYLSDETSSKKARSEWRLQNQNPIHLIILSITNTKVLLGRRFEISLFLSNSGVALAINRDGSSGGCVRLAIISKGGVERILTKGDEVPVYRFSWNK